MTQLKFIRETMERSATFTAVPGWGVLLMGITGIATGLVASRFEGLWWLITWMSAAGLALAIGVGAIILKARRSGAPLFSGSGRKFAMVLIPTLFCGAILTAVLYAEGLPDVLPGMWLLLFGAAVTTGGAVSVPLIPIMGVSYMVLGGIAFLLPASWGNVMLALGFGVFNVIFGVIIVRKYGG
jgi:hypothetical protein